MTEDERKQLIEALQAITDSAPVESVPAIRPHVEYAKKYLRFLTLGLSIVAGGSCAPVPYAVRTRAAESYVLKACLDGTSLSGRKACVAESKRRCREQGMEAACGVDGQW